MLPVLKQKFDKLQSRYGQLKDHLLPLEDSLLHTSPKAGKWSALQIFWHVQQSEFLTVRYVNKKIQSGPYPRTGFRESIRSGMLKWALASPLKFEAPAAVRENIPEKPDKIRLFTDFEENRENLAVFLADFPASRLKEALYRHPRIGYINISQMMDFLYWHFTHHEKQIRAITHS